MIRPILALSILVLFGFLAMSPAMAAEPPKAEQVAQAGRIMGKVVIAMVCDKERAVIRFQNRGPRWAGRATVSAHHDRTGQVFSRKLLFKENQTASFRLPVDKSDGTLVARIDASWLAVPLEARQTVHCQ